MSFIAIAIATVTVTVTAGAGVEAAAAATAVYLLLRLFFRIKITFVIMKIMYHIFISFKLSPNNNKFKNFCHPAYPIEERALI